MREKLNTITFIAKSKEVHQDKYDYSKTEYVRYQEKVCIICPEHGEFMQTPKGHLNGHGCKKCADAQERISRSLGTDAYIIKAKLIYGDQYNYSKVKYINNSKKIKIICNKKGPNGKEHGVFEQSPASHLKGYGCPRCSVRHIYTQEEIISRFNEKHKYSYDYSLVEYRNMKDKVKIICPKHGIFEQSPSNHIYQNGCPKCKLSTGETKIKNILDDHNVNYIMEYVFPNCKYKAALPFDFYIESLNTCIEFNGRQHYIPIDYFGGTPMLAEQIIRDKIKIEYCRKNKIKLLIIKYTDDPKEKLKEFNIIK